MSKLILKTEGDNCVIITRRFAAPPEALYRAPDNRIETRFEADGTGTLLTMRMELPDVETRSRMLASGMESGMEASYVRLESMI